MSTPEHNRPYVSRLVTDQMTHTDATRYHNDALYHHDIDIAVMVLCAVANAMSARGITFDTSKLILNTAIRQLLNGSHMGEQ